MKIEDMLQRFSCISFLFKPPCGYLYMNVYEQIYEFRGYGLRFYLYFLSYHTHHYQNCFI